MPTFCIQSAIRAKTEVNRIDQLKKIIRAWGGNPPAIIKAAEQGKVGILISEDIVAEISEVLTYPKLEKTYRSKLHRKDLIEQVLRAARFVQVKSSVKVIEEHPADNKFLECALAANADFG